MRDAGHDESDALLKKMQAEVEDVYRTAQKDLQKKIDDYVGKFAKDDAKKQKLVANGKMSQEDYDAWKQKTMLTGKQYRQMLDTVSTDLTNADKIARSIINGYTPEAYAVGMNYGTYQVESGTTFNTNFTLYNRETVERLLRDDPQLLPMPKVNIPKDKAWNYKQVNRQLTQGILQGESMPKIAKRFEAVTPSKTVADIKDAYKKTSEQIAKEIAHKNKVAAIRNARTAVTGAENAGRMDSFYRAKEMGIGVKKQWLATPDGRTRDSHVEIDLEVVELEENFSNGCEYPGDPGGDPAEVYNCRCAMIPWLDRFGDKFDGERMMNLHGMTYDEWKEGHNRQAKETDNVKFDLKNEVKEIEGVLTEAKNILPVNQITDENKFFALTYDFEHDGYSGRPIVVGALGDDQYQALTGSHRIFAARQAGIEIPTVVLPYDEHTGELFSAFDDDERAKIAEELFQKGFIDRDAYLLLKYEASEQGVVSAEYRAVIEKKAELYQAEQAAKIAAEKAEQEAAKKAEEKSAKKEAEKRESSLEMQEYKDYLQMIKDKYGEENMWREMTDNEMDTLDRLERIAYRGR